MQVGLGRSSFRRYSLENLVCLFTALFFIFRNKVKEVARCVEKQITWCMTGKKKNVLDALQLPNFNSQVQYNNVTLKRGIINFQ